MDDTQKKYLKDYYTEQDGVYTLKELTEDEKIQINDAFALSSDIAVRALQSLSKTEGTNTEETSTEETKTLDITEIYPMLPMLKFALPEDKLSEFRNLALQDDASIRDMMGIALAESFMIDAGIDLTKLQQKYILQKGLGMLIIALLGGLATILVSYISSRVASGVTRNIRRAVFEKVESFTAAEFDKFSTASLITRTTNDLTHIQMLLNFGIRMLCYAPIMGFGGIFMAVRKSPSMSWIIALAVVVLLTLVVCVMVVAMPKFKIMQKLVDRLNLVSRETLTGLMVIRAFGTEPHEEARFDEANEELTQTSLFVNRVMVLMMPVMMLIMNGVTLLTIWVGSHKVVETGMPIGDMMAYMQYAMHVIISFLFMSMMFIFVPRAAVAAGRIADVLGTNLSVLDPENPKEFTSKSTVEFRNVSFRYFGGEEDALSQISFTANPGETTAFIGSTGSGKTTIANLILRFYDATAGDVFVDGVNVKDVRQQDLRSKIGYVPQKNVLITGTIESNISYGTYGRQLSPQELQDLAETAQAMEFIKEKENGFSEEISQGGSNVSGGQKQRLSIARALARKPEIYIFDDSFSALDFKTDRTLRSALKEKVRDACIILVAQRVSTIMNAEQIIVLEKGKIVGKGTHRELLKTCPEYLEIASSQLSEDELGGAAV